MIKTIEVALVLLMLLPWTGVHNLGIDQFRGIKHWIISIKDKRRKG